MICRREGKRERNEGSGWGGGGGGGGGKRGREVSTAGKRLRGLTGGEVVQASPMQPYKPDDLVHLHCKNKT